MPQATAITPARIKACAARFTLLNADGTPHSPPNNAYILTGSLISLAINPIITAAATAELDSGCDDQIGTYTTPAKFGGFTLAMIKGTLNPALESLLLGSSVINDSSTIPVPIGVQWPASGASPPPIACEFWSKLIIGDHSPGGADTGIPAQSYPYVRYIFPMTFWAPDNDTLNTDFGQPPLQATTRGNVNWVSGPWGDQPVAAQSQGFYIYDATIPTGHPGFVSTGS